MRFLGFRSQDIDLDEKEQRPHFWRRSLLLFCCGWAFVALVAFLRYRAGTQRPWSVHLSDGCLGVATLLLGFAGLRYAVGQGFFKGMRRAYRDLIQLRFGGKDRYEKSVHRRHQQKMELNGDQDEARLRFQRMTGQEQDALLLDDSKKKDDTLWASLFVGIFFLIVAAAACFI